MFVLLLICVVVLDRNFDNKWLHVELVGDLLEHVDFVRNSNFLDHRHFDLLDHRVLLYVMMVDCVDAMGLFVLDFTVGGINLLSKCFREILVLLTDAVLPPLQL